MAFGSYGNQTGAQLTTMANLAAGDNETANLIKKAIDCLQKYHHWHEGLIQNAQHLALEGEKRRHRYFACKLHNMVLHKICKVYDVYGADIWYTETETAFSNHDNSDTYFIETLKGFIAEHNELHSIANSLVVAHAKEFAACLYDLACEIQTRCIVDLRRKIKQSIVIKSGKSDHHTLIWEQSWKDDANTHDFWENKE